MAVASQWKFQGFVLVRGSVLSHRRKLKEFSPICELPFPPSQKTTRECPESSRIWELAGIHSVNLVGALILILDVFWDFSPVF